MPKKKLPDNKTDSAIVRVRVKKFILAQWDTMCEQKNIDRSSLIRYAVNLVIQNPALLEDPKIESSDPGRISEKLLQELKELIISQKEEIRELKLELGQLTQVEGLRQEEYFKRILKEQVFTLLTKSALTIEGIRQGIRDPQLQIFLFPKKGEAFSVLDDALTELLEEGLIAFKKGNNTYSVSSESL